jgi:hypothetical protein
MKKEENNSLTPFEARFMREGVFMPHGSDLNAFAIINQGKGMSIEEFKKVSMEIFKMDLEKVKIAIEMAKKMELKELDFPKK